MAAAWSWRDASGVAAPAQWMLYAEAALSALAAAAAWDRRLDPGSVGQLEPMLWLAQLVVYAAAAVLTLRWIYLANTYARALGADDMMVRPGWAVGWFFVPLANLVMPFIAMRELWKASVNPRDWQGESAPLIVSLWWGCWIASGIAGAVAFRLGLDPAKEVAVAGEIASFVSLLLSVPAALLLTRIIAGVQGRLDRFSPGGAEALKDHFA